MKKLLFFLLLACMIGCNQGNQPPKPSGAKQDSLAVCGDTTLEVLKLQLTVPSLVLLAASPNPTTDSTIIGFTTRKLVIFSLEVFNEVGESVFVAARNVSADSGTHLFIVPSQTFPDGIYVYRLTTSNETLSNRFAKE